MQFDIEDISRRLLPQTACRTALTKVKNPENLEDYKLNHQSVLETFVEVPDKVEDETVAKIRIR